MPATGSRTSSSLTVGSPWSKRSRPPPPWACRPGGCGRGSDARGGRGRPRSRRRPRRWRWCCRSLVLRPSLRLSGRPPRSLRSLRSGPRLPPSRLPPSRLPSPPSRLRRCGRAAVAVGVAVVAAVAVAVAVVAAVAVGVAVAPPSRLRGRRGRGCAAGGRPRCARRRRARVGAVSVRLPEPGGAVPRRCRPRRTANRPAGGRRGGRRVRRALGGAGRRPVSGPPLAPPLTGPSSGPPLAPPLPRASSGASRRRRARRRGAGAPLRRRGRPAGADAAHLTGGDGGDEVALAHPAGAGDAQLAREALQLGQQHPGQAVAAAPGAARRPRSGRCLGRAGGVLRAGLDEVGGFTHVQVLPCGDLRVPAQGVPRSPCGPARRRERRRERVEKMRGGSAAKRDRLLRPRARLARVGGYAVSLDAAHGLDNTGGSRRVPRYREDTSGAPASTSAPAASTSSGSAVHPAGVSARDRAGDRASVRRRAQHARPGAGDDGGVPARAQPVDQRRATRASRRPAAAGAAGRRWPRAAAPGPRSARARAARTGRR